MLGRTRRIHFVGIGGIGMSGIAELLANLGYEVSGSDAKTSELTTRLEKLGVRIAKGHDAANVRETDVVVTSSAIQAGNAEVEEARRRRIPVIPRAEMLAELMRLRYGIAVAGAHGKTTTTSMIAHVLERTGSDPTYVIGGDPNETGSGARSGSSDLFVAEADESDGSFLLMRPEVGIITNVDVDHVDFYPGGREEIEDAFAAFADRSALVVVCADDEGAMRSMADVETPTVTYGTDASAAVRLEIVSVGPGGARGILHVDGEAHHLALSVDGAHNLRNAAAAVAACAAVGADTAAAVEALASFGGVHRRFELRGAVRDATFYDDYGHVPVELAVTLDVARRTGPERLVAVFQPHRYSRTQALWRELGAGLVEADVVVVTDVYGAAQDPIPGVTGKLIVRGIAQADPSTRVVYLPHRADVIEYLDHEVRGGDLVITMGCGDVWMLGDAALDRIREGDGVAPTGART
jgi:UDP-N-acetylmuramate--alanine ligase